MPEQEKRAESVSPGMEELGDSMLAETTQGGAADIKPTIILAPMIIAAGMAFLLAFINGATIERIEENKKNDLRQKLEVVVLGATAEAPQKFANDPVEYKEELLSGKNTVDRYTGELPDGGIGYGITSKVNTGYSGGFSMVFGVTPEGEVTQARVLETKETPGLGSKVEAPEWIAQFEGKSLDDFVFGVKQDSVANREGDSPASGSVDAITGATITSRAVCDAIRQGLLEVEKTPPGEYVPKAAEPAAETTEPIEDGGETDGE